MVATTSRLSLGPWTDGVVYALPPEDVLPTALAGMQNVEVGLGGFIKTRPGFTKHIASAIGGTPTITAVGKAKFSASSSARFCIAGAVFYEDASGTWTDRTAAITITAGDDNTWTWVDCNGDMYATSNSNADVQIKWAAAGGNIANATVSSRFTKAKWCEWWDNRLWYLFTDANEERVWYSDILTPETIGATSFLNFGVSTTGIKALQSVLTIHSEDSIHIVYYDNALSAYVQQRRAAKGTVSGRSIVVNGAGEMFFVRKDGIYSWTPGSLVATENAPTPTKISIPLDGSRYWDSINTDRLHQCFAIDNEKKNCVWFMLPHGTGQTDMNHIMVYDYARQIWYGPYLDFTRNCGAYFDDAPFLGGYDDGLVYTHDSGTNDNGVAIDAWAETAAAAGIELGVEVRWLWAQHAFGVTGNYDTTVQQLSARTVARTETFNAGGGFPSIGSFIIGISSIAGETILRQDETPTQGYSDSIQLKYSNANLDESFNIRRATVPFRPIGIVPHSSSGVN